MDFKKLGKQVGQLRKQAEDKLGDRVEPGNLKRDAKELREILAGDGSLVEKAKQAKEEVIDREESRASGDGRPEVDSGRQDSGESRSADESGPDSGESRSADESGPDSGESRSGSR
ncbi:MAG: hypothetical protein IT199_03285 [Solirubrobacterales bacterium]|nr:hypothetical protein [Solirubrobacterales bacterium]